MIVSAEAAGHLLGLATDQPHAVAVFEDLLGVGDGLDLVERPVTTDEVDGPPRTVGGRLPVALVRGDRRIPFDDPAFARTEAGDVVVAIAAMRP